MRMFAPETWRGRSFAPPLSNMLSLIDLASPQLKVVDCVLLPDGPIHVLPHPDGKRFVVGAVESFYLYKILNGKLVQVSRSRQEHGLPCFWITPRAIVPLRRKAVWMVSPRAFTGMRWSTTRYGI